MKRSIFVANWKMYPSFSDMVDWCDRCAQEGTNWFGDADVIVCPESTYFPFIYTALAPAVHIGAQDCSLHSHGAFTGEVSTAHLAEVDIFYTLVGHHERRLYHHETAEVVARKGAVALTNGVTPILCVSDQSDAEAVFTHLATGHADSTKVICAYEPTDAIGAGYTADKEKIRDVCASIRRTAEKFFPHADIFVLYGGGINEKSMESLRTIDHIDGLLIGKASTDFQAFKNIVSFFMDRKL